MGEFAVGQGVSRFEDPRLLRGGGRYVDDIKLPGMAHGVVLRSQHAHAKILRLDTTAAKAAPGVLAVLTSADIKAAGLSDLPVPGGLKRRDGSAMYKPRYPILAETHVRWVGDCVALAQTTPHSFCISPTLSSSTASWPPISPLPLGQVVPSICWPPSCRRPAVLRPLSHHPVPNAIQLLCRRDAGGR